MLQYRPQLQQYPPVQHCCQKVQLYPHNVTGLPDQLVVTVGICYSYSAAPAHNSKQNSTGHHRLIKHPQHSPADVKGAEPPQKIEAALSLLVKDFSVLSPVQFVVDEHPQIFVVSNNVHVMPQDGNLGQWCPGSPQIHHKVFGLCYVELQVVQLTPCDKVVHHSSVLSLLTLADTSNYSRVIRKLLKMARLCLVAEVCGVKGEEERREDSPLWGPGVADHCI